MQKHKLGHLFALLTNICYGMNFLFLKLALRGNALPIGISTFRVVGAWLFFLVLYLSQKRKTSLKAIPAKHWLLFLVAGICGASINQVTLVEGIQKSTVLHGASIGLLLPVCVLFWESLFLGKVKFDFLQYVGIAMGVLGAAVMILFTKSDKTPSIVGDMLIFMNFFMFGLYLVIMRFLIKQYDSKLILLLSFSFGLLAMGGAGLFYDKVINIDEMETLAYFGILGSIVFASILAQVFQNESLKYINASLSSSYIYMQPIFGTFLAVLFLGEEITLAQFTAFVCMSIGLYLTSFRDIINFDRLHPKKLKKR